MFIFVLLCFLSICLFHLFDGLCDTHTHTDQYKLLYLSRSSSARNWFHPAVDADADDDGDETTKEAVAKGIPSQGSIRE